MDHKPPDGRAASIDGQLSIAEARWPSLPEVEREIDSWDPEDAVTFVFEWGVEDHRLSMLEEDARSGLMTPEQLARYERLKRVVAQNRPIIERLQNS